MLIVHGLSLYFGDRCLLSDGALQIAAGERVALLGDNGSGKSTLLRVLAGDLGAVRSGTIQRRGMTRIAYLEQDNAGHDDLSSGQRMRRRLSEALSAMPELLLLDEPTNHLDESGLAWLERALLGFGGAVLFACHDRAFIDAVATRVLLLERGRLSAYRGGYEDFARQRAAERSAQQHRHEEWRRERERLRASAERQRRWADKAHHAAGERNPVGKKRAAKLMHKAIAAEARVGRWDSVREPKPYEETPLAFDFLPPSDLPSVLLRAADLTFTYRGASAPALGPVSLDLRRGERLALVGDNGSGKTTLLQAIAAAGGAGDGADGDRRGVLRVHPNARIFFLRQDDAPAEGGTALGELLAAGAPDAASARTLLGHFQLRGETALQPVSQLSPGERVRLRLAAALVRGADILLLDEPTNHLDLAGRVALSQALRAYPGTVLFATHDRRLREEAATRQVGLGSRAREVLAAGFDEREILRMRLADLTTRLGHAGIGERARLEQEIAGLVAELRRS